MLLIFGVEREILVGAGTDVVYCNAARSMNVCSGFPIRSERIFFKAPNSPIFLPLPLSLSLVPSLCLRMNYSMASKSEDVLVWRACIESIRNASVR